ncbi:thiosulfate/3-mercaptopyruvate sulfurtransferase [Kordia periserrulae]|uniref:Thiosulfate/3-mercaptopyruvate sulfurtransferase n=1 Tax=Kordia periserrulae TaxID=701523 RepID=A0A2T6C062_9FLAO|nr:sulfurtransferase [Kordia periserrulae]PTX61637.1 thiosulfate/3-mercaptopyruvate sulfurtransferase [Kordia periserrulae]
MYVHLENPIISVDWLCENLSATNLVILNGTIPKVVNATYQAETHQISNARFFDIKNTFSDTAAPFPNTMVDAVTFTKEAQKLGINQDSAIVVYDELGIYASPRVWYMFKTMGFDNIAVLNGGFPAWKARNYPIEVKKVYQGNHGNFQAKSSLHRFKNYTAMLQIVQDEAAVILDARSEARFTGQVPEPRKGLRSGTIPTSKNLPYTEVLQDYHFKSTTDLQNIFSSFQHENSPFVFSCGSGITACILALAAELADYTDYAVYDGSWTEWGTLYN